MLAEALLTALLTGQASVSPPLSFPPRVGPEAEVEPRFIYGQASLPKVGFDGTQLLVAWTDDRISRQDVWARRLDAAGRPLDAAAILLRADGTRYVTVLTDGLRVLRYARVTPAGQ